MLNTINLILNVFNLLLSVLQTHKKLLPTETF